MPSYDLRGLLFLHGTHTMCFKFARELPDLYQYANHSHLEKGNIFLLSCTFIFSLCNFSTVYSIGYLEGTVVLPMDFGKPHALGAEPRKEAPQGKQCDGGLRTADHSAP